MTDQEIVDKLEVGYLAAMKASKESGSFHGMAYLSGKASGFIEAITMLVGIGYASYVIRETGYRIRTL